MKWCQIDGATYDQWDQEWQPMRKRVKKAARRAAAAKKAMKKNLVTATDWEREKDDGDDEREAWDSETDDPGVRTGAVTDGDMPASLAGAALNGPRPSSALTITLPRRPSSSSKPSKPSSQPAPTSHDPPPVPPVNEAETTAATTSAAEPPPPPPKKRRKGYATSESSDGESDGSGLNGSYWSVGAEEAGRRRRKPPPPPKPSANPKKPQGTTARRATTKSARSKNAGAHARQSRHSGHTSASGANNQSHDEPRSRSQTRPNTTRFTLFTDTSDLTDSDGSDFVASANTSPRKPGAGVRASSPGLDSLQLEYPAEQSSTPVPPPTAKAKVDGTVTSESLLVNVSDATSKPTSSPVPTPAAVSLQPSAVEIPAAHPAKPRKPHPTSTSKPTAGRTLHASSTSNIPNVSATVSQLERLISDRDRLLAENAEVKAARKEMRGIVLEGEKKIAELEERIQEMKEEMEFTKDLLEWEKKKVRKMKEENDRDERERESRESEREVNNEALNEDRDQQENSTVTALQEELKESERRKTVLEERVAYLEDALDRANDQVVELQKSLEKEMKKASLTPAPVVASSSTATPEPPTSSSPVIELPDPNPTPEADNRRPSPPNATATASSNPPASIQVANDLAPQTVGSLLLTEVASWSAMSMLLQQASSSSSMTQPDAASRSAEASRQAAIDQMVRLCKEREAFLFNISGLLSSVYQPAFEGSLLNLSANGTAPSTSLHNAQRTGYVDEDPNAASLVWDEDQAEEVSYRRNREGIEEFDEELDRQTLEERISVIEARLKKTERLRSQVLADVSHRRGELKKLKSSLSASVSSRFNSPPFRRPRYDDDYDDARGWRGRGNWVRGGGEWISRGSTSGKRTQRSPVTFEEQGESASSSSSPAASNALAAADKPSSKRRRNAGEVDTLDSAPTETTTLSLPPQKRRVAQVLLNEGLAGDEDVEDDNDVTVS
ncbi:hypothetical protein ONZ45_g2898 [Pleurotus djamor]|nr:hypothetical protein ONZ45_g2898 [Pleurotus djamor]